MHKDNMGVLKGIGTGLAAGMLVGYVGGQVMQNQPPIKRSAGKAAHIVGDLLGNAAYFFKHI